MKRTCTKCSEPKPLTKDNYHTNKKGQLFFSAMCKLCRNSQKQSKKNNTLLKIKIYKVPVSPPKPQKVIVVAEETKKPYRASKSLIESLSKKLDSRFTITVDKDSNIERIQTHGYIKAMYQRESLDDLLAVV